MATQYIKKYILITVVFTSANHSLLSMDKPNRRDFTVTNQSDNTITVEYRKTTLGTPERLYQKTVKSPETKKFHGVACDDNIFPVTFFLIGTNEPWRTLPIENNDHLLIKRASCNAKITIFKYSDDGSTLLATFTRKIK